MLRQVDAIDPARHAAVRSRQYMVVITTVYAALLGVLLSRSWFLSDDLQNFGLLRESGLNPDYLRLGIFGHFAPGHRFLDWVVFHFWPMDWLPPALVVSITLLATAWTLHLIVRLLAPTRSWPTLLVMLFSASPLVLATAVWWAAAAHSLPAMLLSSVATLAALRYDRRPRWTDATWYALSLGVALLFYEKAALTPIGIALLVWAVQPRHDGFRGVARLVHRCRALVATSLLLLAAFAVVVKLGDYDQGVPTPTASTWWRWLVHLVTAGPFAGASGVSPDDYAHGARQALLVGAGLVVLAVLVMSVVYFRGAWRAWVYLAAAFLPGVALTAYGRAAAFGPGIASDFHYSPELAPAVVIALTVAFTRPRRQPIARAESRSALRLDALVAIVLAPILAVSVVSDFRAVDHFGGAANRRFFDNVEKSAKALDLSRRAGHFSVLNTDVPASVVPPAFEPFNQVSRLLDLFPATRNVSDEIDPAKQLLVVLPNGALTRARLAPIGDLRAAAGACLPPSTLRVPAGTLTGKGRRTTLFASVEGRPTPGAVSVRTEAASAVRTQPIQGAPDGRPVRLWAMPRGSLTVAALPGSCLTHFTLLRPERTGKRSV